MKIWWGETWKALSTGLEHGHFQETRGLLLLLLLLPSSTLLVVIHLLGLTVISEVPKSGWRLEICLQKLAWTPARPRLLHCTPQAQESKSPFLNKCQSPTAQPTQSQWPGRLAPYREVLNRKSGLSRCHLTGFSKATPGFCKFWKVRRKLSAQGGLAVL